MMMPGSLFRALVFVLFHTDLGPKALEHLPELQRAAYFALHAQGTSSPRHPPWLDLTMLFFR